MKRFKYFFRKFRYNRKRSTLAGVLVLLCLSLTLGFAYLTTELNINGIANISSSRWDIHFENIEIEEGSVEATTEPTISNDTTITFTATLSNPGDFYKFTTDIVNDGTYDAKIDSITLSPTLTSEEEEYFEYKIEYTEGGNIQVDDALDAGTSENITILFKYKTNADSSVYPEEDTNFTVEVTITYVQGKGNEVNHTTLYSVLKDAASDGTYAREYTGEHHDSFTKEPSKKIYHWYGSNDTNGTAILDKNNVVFAGICWQMIRTTDTGGVRLLYNGEPTITEVAGETYYDCGTTRPGKIGSIRSTTRLNGSYYYGDGYTTSVSGNTTTFTLTNPVQVTVNSSNASTTILDIAANYPYTCKKTSADGTCTNAAFYKVDSQSSSYNAYVYASTYRDSIGQSAFNSNYDSVGDVGYMYNTRYPVTSTTISGSNTMLSSVTLSSSNLTTYGNYYFGDNYSMSGNNHALTNPVKGNTITDYPASWVGKYMCQSSSSSSCGNLYYISAIDTSGTNPIIYSTDIASGKEYNDASYKYLFGDSIVDQGDGTIEVKDNIQEVVKRDWNTEYSTKVGKYVCMPGYYTYDSVNNKYICSDGGSGNKGALRYITATTIANFTATNIYKYGFGIESYNSSYKLVSNNNEDGTLQYIYNWPNTSNTSCFTNQGDTISNCGYKSLSKSHYTCYNLSGVCNNYYYINSTSDLYTYSASITGGKYVSTDLTDPNNILYEMLSVNTTNSIIKDNIDLWYQNTLLTDYDAYIDDTIYCNNRKIREVSGVKQFGGWNPNGGTTDTNFSLQFNEYNVTNDLSCPNVLDQFSVSNTSAQLTYKVGLMAISELNLLNQNNARVSAGDYWLATPDYFNNDYAYGRNVLSTGNLYGYYVGRISCARPSVSLVPGTKYTGGTGSMNDPYIVE